MKSSSAARIAPITAMLFAFLLWHPVAAKEINCIPLGKRGVDSTEIIDEESIRFRMSSGSDYLVTLESPCNGLELERGFSYSTRSLRLCDTDIITVNQNGAICQIKTINVIDDTPEKGAE